MKSARRRAIVWLPSLAAVVLAVVLAAAAAMPYARVQRAIDALSPKGHSEGFTPAFFESVRVKIRIASLVLLAAAPLLFVLRRRLADAAVDHAQAFRGYAGELVRRSGAVVRSERAGHLCLLAGIVATGVWLRAAALSQPINYDEAFTFVTYVRRPLWVSLANYSYPNNHLLHTVLAHASTAVFGVAPWALRLPAFLAGCCLIPLTYAVARMTWDRTVGLVAAGLVSVSEVLIAFSVCARGYTLIGVFFLLLLVCAEDILRGDRRGWTVVVPLVALGFYTVPTFLYAYLTVASYIVVSAARDRRAGGHTIADLALYTAVTGAIVALLYLPPMLVTGLSSGLTYGYNGAPAAFAAGPAFLRFLAESGIDLTRSMPRALSGTLIAAAAIGVAAAPRRSAITLLAAIATWMAIATVVQRVVMPPRVWLFAAPLYVCFVAAGIAWGAERIARQLNAGAAIVDWIVAAAVIAPLCGLAWFGRPAQYTEVFGPEEIAMNQDASAVVADLKSRLQPHDAVISVFPTVDLLEYYFWRDRMPTLPLKSVPLGTERYLVVTNEAIGQPIDDVLAKAGISGSAASAHVLARFRYNTVYEMPAGRDNLQILGRP